VATPRTLDVRGLSCPQPALDVNRELSSTGECEFLVLVDCGAAEENVSRAARRAGWTVETQGTPSDGGVAILLRRGA
jgi:tRNA 2-thiouridine synthesizing protein A